MHLKPVFIFGMGRSFFMISVVKVNRVAVVGVIVSLCRGWTETRGGVVDN
jgi:hypothetical protein